MGYGSIGGKGGTTQPGPGQPGSGQNYGNRPELNQFLAGQYNYGGDFSGGQWGDWSRQNLTPQQMEANQRFMSQYDQGWRPGDPRDLGARQDLNQFLANRYGYTGDFSQGQWGDWARANLTDEQRAYNRRALDAYDAGTWRPPAPAGAPGEQPSNWLGEGALQGLSDAYNFLQENAQMNPGELQSTDLSAYLNPYQQNVVDVTMREMNRQNELQRDMLYDRAQAAGAYGGDRHGVAEAEMQRNFADQQQRWLANFGHENFNQAMARAQQDIANRQWQKQTNLGAAGQAANLANMGFGWNRQIQQDMASAGAAQEQMMQNIINQAMMQQQGIYGWPQQQVGFMNQSLPGVQGGSNQTYNPGFFDYASLIAGAGSRLLPRF